MTGIISDTLELQRSAGALAVFGWLDGRAREQQARSTCRPPHGGWRLHAAVPLSHPIMAGQLGGPGPDMPADPPASDRPRGQTTRCPGRAAAARVWTPGQPGHTADPA